MIITDEDILKAEQILGISFDKERRDVIRCMETKDFQACPGSGKTTTLIAKLFVLANKMPFDGNRAICVLTHTNIAVNTIKTKLGSSGNKLLNYPNYIGTIQSFVDKYLAIPCYINIFGNRPYPPDNDAYYERLNAELNILYNLKRRTKAWIHKSGIWPFYIRYDFNSFKLLNTKSKDIQSLETCNGITSEICNNIQDVKLKIMKEGALSYEDYYTLANVYLNEIYPNYANILSKRFIYVAMDESQDSDLHQFEIIKKIFNMDNVILQFFGDKNQSIFYSTVHDCAWETKESLNINGSKRFSCEIANRIKNIGLEPQELIGNELIPNIKPIIILFEDAKIKEVINKFGDIIVENKLHLSNPSIFKAVGWTKQPDSKHGVKDYWDGFSVNKSYNTIYFNSLFPYLQKVDDETIKKRATKYYYFAIIRAFVKVAKILNERNKSSSNNSHFTEISLIKYLNEFHHEYYNKLKTISAKWIKEIHKGIDIFDEVRSHIRNDFLLVFSATEKINLLNDFLDKKVGEIENNDKSAKSNIYHYNNDTVNFEIEIGTVHGVKGETHIATLYLETFKEQYDLHTILEFLKGKRTKIGQREKNALKISYVGMSRPSHLLCIAMHKNTFGRGNKILVLSKKDIEELKTVGWKVIEI